MKILKLILFNFYTKHFLKQADGGRMLNQRMKSSVADFYFSMAIFFPVVAILMITQIFSKDAGGFGIGFILSLIPFSVILATMLNKDDFKARSVGKRIYGYQVNDIRNHQLASPIRCMVRNLTIFIWPVEVFWVAFNPERRLGDFLAGTRIVKADPISAESILIDIVEIENYRELWKTILLSVLASLLLTFLVTYPEFRK